MGRGVAVDAPADYDDIEAEGGTAKCDSWGEYDLF